MRKVLGLWTLVFVSSDMRSVPSRGSVGSMFRRRVLIGEVDPTLPRDGTDIIPLQFRFSQESLTRGGIDLSQCVQRVTVSEPKQRR